MEWIKVSIQTTSAGTEVLTGLLLARGVSGMEIIDPREYGVFLQQDKQSWDYVDPSLVDIPSADCAYVVFYLPADDGGNNALTQIQEQLRVPFPAHTPMGTLTVRTESVDDAVWLNEWKKHFTPIYIKNVAVVPVWETTALPNPPEIIFTLDPGSAFGTGQHATTYLCVEALQDYLQPGHTMLDAGCGSGILSIIGLLLGAAHAVACDIDPAALSATQKNAELNPVDLSRLQTLHGDIINDNAARAAVNTLQFDIIAANIVADAVMGLLPFVPALLKRGGYFIASGIIVERAEDVRAAIRGSGLAMVSDKEMDGWHCMVCVHG